MQRSFLRYRNYRVVSKRGKSFIQYAQIGKRSLKKMTKRKRTFEKLSTFGATKK